MKTCTRCKVGYPLSEFHRQSGTKDGLKYYCKACCRDLNAPRMKTWNAAHPDYYREYYRQHVQQYKARAKARYDADPEAKKRAAAQWQAQNVEKVRAYKKAWRDRNPATVREYTRRHQAIRRAARAAVRFSAADLLAKVAYWADRCWMCHGPWSAIDHVKPLSKGGAHVLANLRPICTPCNSRKQSRWPLAQVN